MGKCATFFTWVLLVLALAGASAAFTPAHATGFAQSLGPVEDLGWPLPEDDLSRVLIFDHLFGRAISDDPSGEAGPLTSVIKIFNSIMLLLGGIFMAYTIVAGTMTTAHDGTMLGKKWSSLWIPIRTSLGAVAILPIIGGGWCIAQVVVIRLAMFGVAIANALWGAYLSNGVKSAVLDTNYHGAALASGTRSMFEGMLLSTVCVKAWQQHTGQVQSEQSAAANMGFLGDGDFGIFPATVGYLSPGITLLGAGVENISVSQIIYGKKGEVTDRGPSSCGKVVLSMATSDLLSGFEDPDAGAANGMRIPESLTGGAIIDPEAYNAALQSFIEKENKLISDIAVGSAMSRAASAIVNDADNAQQLVVQAIAQSTNRVNNLMFDQVASSYEDLVNEDFMAVMEEDGWLTAGAFYMSFAKAAASISAIVKRIPEYRGSWVSAYGVKETEKGVVSRLFTSESPDVVVSALNRAKLYLNTSNIALSGGAAIASTNNISKSVPANMDWSGRILGMISSAIPDSSAYNQSSASTTNPVMLARAWGSRFINTAIALVAAEAVLVAALGAIPTTSIGAAVAIALMPIVGTITGVAITFGAMLAYYIPMMPYILWIAAIFGWMVLVVEAVFAAPLWAVIHLAPDADGIVGRGGQGYMLVLSLTLRPAMMVLGLIAAFALMVPIGYLVNSTFAAVFSLSAASGGGVGVIGTFAGLIIYAIFMVSIIHRVFGLIHIVPDRLTRWAGGPAGGELGQEAGAVKDHTLAKVGAGFAGVKAVSDTSKGAIQEASQRARSLSNDNAQKRYSAHGAHEQSMDRAKEGFDRAQGLNMSGMNNSGQAGIMQRTAAAEEHSEAAQANFRSSINAAETASHKGSSATPAERGQASSFVAGAKSASQSGNSEQFISSKAAEIRQKQAADPTSVAPFEEQILMADKNQTAARDIRESLASGETVDEHRETSGSGSSSGGANTNESSGASAGASRSGGSGGSSGSGGPSAGSSAESNYSNMGGNASSKEDGDVAGGSPRPAPPPEPDSPAERGSDDVGGSDR